METKMTDEQIIKALECCMDEMGCKKGCPCFDPKSKSSHCMAVGDNGIEKLALDLINRQKAEIERLQKYNTDVAFKHYYDGIKEFAEKITEIFKLYSHLHSRADEARKDYIIAADGTEIEMQSVWDVITLKKNEMAEYDDMNTLQANIETIAKEKLLTELENDFWLLVKEMTEDKK